MQAQPQLATGASVMRANLAVLLDEQLQHGCEIQIKRVKRGVGSRWELTLWESTKGRYPYVRLRLRANTALELVNGLDALDSPPPSQISPRLVAAQST